MILQRVLKVLSSKRLPSAKKIFAQVQVKLLPTMLDRWHSVMTEFIFRLKRRSASTGNNNNTTHQNQPSILVLGNTCVNLCKCIHRLVIYGSSSVRSSSHDAYKSSTHTHTHTHTSHLRTDTHKSFDGTIFLHTFKQRFDRDIAQV